MAYQIPESKYELIQSTISNPEYKAKLTRILSEMSASELAFVMENSPPQERKIIWDLIQLDAEGKVLGELDQSLREQLLIDIRSNIIDLLSLDFDKLNTENILVDNLKGDLFLDGNNFINIDAIELNFGSAQAIISGIVSSNIEYLDTYDLNLVFDSNISQNIPWYFALFGNIPAAAGAAVISNLLEQDGNKLFSAKYKISGTTDNLEVSPMQ